MGLAGYGARVEGIPAVEAALASGRVRKLRVVKSLSVFTADG